MGGENLGRRLKSISAEELLQMVGSDAMNYTEEAIAAAEQEIKARGGKHRLEESVEAMKRLAKLELPMFNHESATAEVSEGEFEDEESQSEEPTGKRKLKDECIFGEYYWMLQNAAGHSQRIFDGVREAFTEAKLDNYCHWDLREVRSQGLLTRRRRDLLVIEHDWFHDHHMYIGVRDYGTFLDCCQFLTVEPGFLKKMVSRKISGDATYISNPKNILAEQDLRAWWEAVTIICEDEILRLAADLKLPEKRAIRQGRGYLG